MTKFQIILTGVFIFFIVAGVLAFATFRGSGQTAPIEVTFWGTLPKTTMDTWLSGPALKSTTVKINYVEKDPNTFESDFVEALASNQSPDIVMFPQDLLLRQFNKLFVLPFSSLSERDFKDTFIQEGELFLTADGVVGLPFTVDPMVMYWNRSMLSSANIATPPKFWDEFYTIAPTFNQKNQAGNLTTTIVALGGFDNIKNAKQILSLLILQSGNPIISTTAQGLTSVLANRFNSVTSPTESALRFYTEFANPVKPTYSWSKGMSLSQDAFAGETLATYFGFSSELATIRRKNPNLNFDVTVVPQVRGGKEKVTFGNMNALVIPKNSLRQGAAVVAESLMTSNAALDALTKLTNLPPVRRDLLSKLPPQAFQSVFFSSALISKAWLDPSFAETSNIFKEMVETVISGKDRIDSAVTRADGELNQLIQLRK